ncbi:MAG: hypothetical protein AAB789_00655 [Patescibacteria group bacterium]
MARTKLKELNKVHREAIRLRYEGNTAEEAVEKLTALGLKTTKKTYEQWFETGGLLEVEYEKYCHEQKDIEARVEATLRARAQHIMKGAVKTASEMLVALMGSDRDEVKLKAAIKLVEQEFGKDIQPVSGHLTYEQIIRELEREKDEYSQQPEGDD